VTAGLLLLLGAASAGESGDLAPMMSRAESVLTSCSDTACANEPGVADALFVTALGRWVLQGRVDAGAAGALKTLAPERFAQLPLVVQRGAGPPPSWLQADPTTAAAPAPTPQVAVVEEPEPLDSGEGVPAAVAEADTEAAPGWGTRWSWLTPDKSDGPANQRSAFREVRVVERHAPATEDEPAHSACEVWVTAPGGSDHVAPCPESYRGLSAADLRLRLEQITSTLPAPVAGCSARVVLGATVDVTTSAVPACMVLLDNPDLSITGPGGTCALSVVARAGGSVGKLDVVDCPAHLKAPLRKTVRSWSFTSPADGEVGYRLEVVVP
jgi:hypothetical protein